MHGSLAVSLVLVCLLLVSSSALETHTSDVLSRPIELAQAASSMANSPCRGADCLAEGVSNHHISERFVTFRFVRQRGHDSLLSKDFFFFPFFGVSSTLPSPSTHGPLTDLPLQSVFAFYSPRIQRSVAHGDNFVAGPQRSLSRKPTPSTPKPSHGQEHHRSTIRSKLASSDYSATVVPTNQWSNATFESKFCSEMKSDTQSVTVFYTNYPNIRFLLPDCFFEFANVMYISAVGLIVQGTAAFPDPLDRLASGMNANAAANIDLSFSTLIPFESGPYAPDWDQVWNRFPSLTGLSLQGCGLRGTLPTELPLALKTFSIEQNSFSGSISPAIFQNYISSSDSTFNWNFGGNNLSGTIPESLLAPLSGIGAFTLSLENNRFSGTISDHFLALPSNPLIAAVTLRFGNNLITGAIPSDLWGLSRTLTRLVSLSISGASNILSGSIPSGWLSQYAFPELLSLRIDLSACQLSESIHVGVIPGSSPVMTSYTLILKNNPLNTPIPSAFLPTVLSNSYGTSTPVLYAFDFSSCGLTGTLDLPSTPSSLAGLLQLSLTASFNSLTSFSAGANTLDYLYLLDVADNRALQGSIDSLFASSSITTRLVTSFTALSGTMPYLSLVDTSKLRHLAMEGMAIDFCSGGSNRTAWGPSTLQTCSLIQTNVFECESLYPKCAFSVDAPEGPTPSPIAVTCSEETRPSLEYECIDGAWVHQVPVPVPAPLFVPIPIATACSNATKPSNQFHCVGGLWVSNTTITIPVLIIPSGASQTIIVGDLESSSIVFNGLGSTLTVTGCAFNLTSITLTLTTDDLKSTDKIVQQLIILVNSNCSNENLNHVAIESRVRGSTCRKVKASKSVSNGQLSGVFTIDSSPCNRWWIILVSVIFGVVIIGLLILVLFVVLVPTVRYTLMPFSRPRDSKLASA